MVGAKSNSELIWIKNTGEPGAKIASKAVSDVQAADEAGLQSRRAFDMALKWFTPVRPRRSGFQAFLLVGGLTITLAGGPCGPLFAATGDNGVLSSARGALHGHQPVDLPAGPHGCSGACELGAAPTQAVAPCNAAAFDRWLQPDVSAPAALITRIPVLGSDPHSRPPTDSSPRTGALYLQFSKLLI